MHHLRTLLLCSFLVFTNTLYSQTIPWDGYKWLMGTWKGTGMGTKGASDGTFSFRSDLNNQILIRRNHVTETKADGKIATHDDMLIIYGDEKFQPTKAIYFDNEGHSIQYTATITDSSIVFLSEKKANTALYRLTYTLLKNQDINVRFEIAKDGEHFAGYMDGDCHKIR